MKRVRWGVLGTAKIAMKQVIPAMQKGNFCEIAAIASRDAGFAKQAAEDLSISKSYGSYEELLADPEIDAVYIPLPNHLHVPWAGRALQAGKHVLCEKPLALSAAQARELLALSQSYPGLKIMEAFMYRFHPQWQHSKKLVDEGRIGRLRTIQSFFSYYNNDPANIRNKPEVGGGGLMDIGCYPVSLSRFIFGAEPLRVQGLLELDPIMKTDRIASGILDFEQGTSTFTCSTQLMAYQRVNILGEKGRIEIEIPFNAPADRDTRIWIHDAEGAEEVKFGVTDQYTIQADLFSKAVMEGTELPVSLQDAVNNMAVIDALVESDRSGNWQKPL